MNKPLKAFLAFVLGSAAVGMLYAAQSVERYVSPSGTQIYNLDDSGNQTVGGTQTVVGSMTVTGNNVYAGRTSFTPAAVTVSQTTEIPVASTYITLLSSGGFPGNITLTGLPTISTATSVGGSTALPNGTLIFLSLGSTATNQITLQGNGALSGTLLMTAGASQVITSSRTVSFMYNATNNKWNQVRGYSPD